MPRGKRPTATTLERRGGVHSGSVAHVLGDSEPPSGIGLRPEVLGATPRLLVSKDVLLTLPLNHRTGFIVSFVDGAFTVEMILDACAMRRDEALTILSELVARRIIAIDC